MDKIIFLVAFSIGCSNYRLDQSASNLLEIRSQKTVDYNIFASPCSIEKTNNLFHGSSSRLLSDLLTSITQHGTTNPKLETQDLDPFSYNLVPTRKTYIKISFIDKKNISFQVFDENIQIARYFFSPQSQENEIILLKNKFFSPYFPIIGHNVKNRYRMYFTKDDELVIAFTKDAFSMMFFLPEWTNTATIYCYKKYRQAAPLLMFQEPEKMRQLFEKKRRKLIEKEWQKDAYDKLFLFMETNLKMPSKTEFKNMTGISRDSYFLLNQYSPGNDRHYMAVFSTREAAFQELIASLKPYAMHNRTRITQVIEKFRSNLR